MKRIKIILLFALTTLLCVSCSNYLDIKPYGRTIPKTAEEFSALLHEQLNTIDAGNDSYIIGNASQWLTWDAQCGDDFETCLTASGGRTLGVYVGTIISNSSDNYYNNLYQSIRNCNIVLNEMEESNTTETNTIRATAHAMRGVCYYQLLRLFCKISQTDNLNNQQGVPLVMTFDMEERPIRSTMQETIDLIEDDFRKAISYHPSENIYRFTEDVIKGYQARLYFWTKQWDKALPVAQELLNKYPLVKGVLYEKMMTTAYDLAGNQLIKAYRAADTTGENTLSSANSLLQFRPVSLRFLSLFTEEEKTTDIRYRLWVDNKRMAKKTFFCGMRSAEFKLIEAECYYHLGKKDKALQSINELRSHRIDNYSNLTENNLPTLSEKEIITIDANGNALTPLMGLILNERRKELFLEGDRFFELKRNGAPEFWTAYNGQKYTTQKFMYTFPIPAHDMLLVDGLEQNEGYTEISY